MNLKEDSKAIGRVMKREVGIITKYHIYFFIMIIAPLFCFLFFMDLLKEGLPSKLPVAVVDEDNSSNSRALVRSLNTFAELDVALRTSSFSDARVQLQHGNIYGIFYIPENFKKDASTGRQPTISFYTNDTYFLPASLQYKDMRLLGGLANGLVQQTLLVAQGEGGPLLAGKLSPINIDAHPLNNPWLSYSIYLANFLLPAFLCMFVMFTAAYSLTMETKHKKAREWLGTGRNSIIISLMGKMIPQFIVFSIIGTFCLYLLYYHANFPLSSGFFPMFVAVEMMILASQGLAIFFLGLFRNNRLAMSACALWGVLAFSICGFTYPVRSMPDLAQFLSHFFQMRHYFLIYIDQALNGIPIYYSIVNYLALILFILLPLLVLKRLKTDLLRLKYTA